MRIRRNVVQGDALSIPWLLRVGKGILWYGKSLVGSASWVVEGIGCRIWSRGGRGKGFFFVGIGLVGKFERYDGQMSL